LQNTCIVAGNDKKCKRTALIHHGFSGRRQASRLC
jgi:hypothetical protein